MAIELPEGSRHETRQGIDTEVGSISLGGTDCTLHYDIGELAGNYATSRTNGPFRWQRHEVRGKLRMDYALSSQDERDTLLVSFPALGPANFYTTIRDPHDVETILDVMRTVRPLSPSVAAPRLWRRWLLAIDHRRSAIDQAPTR